MILLSHLPTLPMYYFYHDENSEIVSEVVSIVPDTGIKDSLSFSGVVYVQDWGGNFIRGFKHEDGEIYEMIEENESASGRPELCAEEITDWYTCSAVVGVWDWECHYSYTEITSTCVNYSSSAGNYTGGGTSGGISNDDYEPNSGLNGYSTPDDKPKTADELVGQGCFSMTIQVHVRPNAMMVSS